MLPGPQGVPNAQSILGWYDITNYGAMGDGTHDDTAAITAAIAAAGAAGGGVVFFPAKTFYLSGGLTFSQSNVQLVGSGEASVLDTDTGVLVTGDYGWWALRDLKINERNTATFAYGLYVRNGAHDGLIENVTITSGYGGMAIGNTNDASTPYNITVRHCNVSSSGYGAIQTRTGTDSLESPNLTFENCIVTQTATADNVGIEAWTNKTFVRGCRITAPNYNGGASGITFGANDCTAEGNYIEGFSIGMEIGNNTGCKLLGNTVRACGTGIAATTNGTEIDLLIQGNHVFFNDAYTGTTTNGIAISGSTSAVVTDNVVMYETTLPYTNAASRLNATGIYGDTNIRRVVITGCVFANLNTGSHIEASTQAIQFTGCMWDNVAVIHTDSGGGPFVTATNCIFHNVACFTCNTYLELVNCVFHDEADSPLANYPYVQSYASNTVVIRQRGCQFVNVKSSAFGYNTDYYSQGSGYLRPTIEFVEDWAMIQNLGNSPDVFTGPFTAASLSVPYDMVIQAWYLNNYFRKTRGGWWTAGAAIITEGVWSVGDRIQNTAPAASGTEGWVCTTAGTSAPAWVASHAYALNAIVQPTTPNGHVYKCTTAGTSGSAEPTWPTGSGSTVTDGTVVWTEDGAAAVFKTYGTIAS